MRKQTNEVRTAEEEVLLEQDSERVEDEEENRVLGPPKFEELFGAQSKPTEYEFYTVVKGREVLNRFRVKQMNAHERGLWINAGQGKIYGDKEEISRDAPDYLKMSFKLLELAVTDFEFATGEWDDKNDRAFFRRYGKEYGQPTVSETQKVTLFKDMANGPYQYIVEKCIEKNGFALKNEDGAEP